MNPTLQTLNDDRLSFGRDKEVEARCLAIYAETRAFPPIAALRDQGMGFEVLMGPPFVEPPFLFVGYQPGDWVKSVEEARVAGYENWWVKETSHYATADWVLAKRLRQMFGLHERLLENSVGLNAIFVRAKNDATYVKDVPAKQRRLIEAFSLFKVREIVGLVRPKCVVVIGLKAMELLGPSQPDLVNNRGVVLTKSGRFAGRDDLPDGVNESAMTRICSTLRSASPL